MKIAIIGTGGVGGYFGGMLAKAGFEVSFLARGKNLEALQTKGLVVKSILGDFCLPRVNAFSEIKDLGTSDLIILGVKAWQVKEIAADLNAIIHPDTAVLPLQNGIMAIDELKQELPARNILGGLCRIMSQIESPGVINHFGITPVIVFGETDNSKSKRISEIKTIFDKANIQSKISEDIHAELWKKFIAICVCALLAVTKTTYGELRELAETRKMMIDLFNEIYQLSQKAGINISSDFIDKTVAFIDTFPYESTGSLTRDVWEGKASEIEYQNGTVVKLGLKYGIETPVNRFVYNCILPMELKARKKN